MRYAAQIRAARGLLAWSQMQLAQFSGVGLSTIRRMESSKGLIRATSENVWKIQGTFINAGIIFIDETDEGPGVRLKTTQNNLE